MLTDHSKAVIAINSVLPFVAVLSVALRLYARSIKALRLKSSDYTILLALVIQVSQAKTVIDMMQAVTIAHSMAYIYCKFQSPLLSARRGS